MKILYSLITLFFISSSLLAQNRIVPKKGFSPQIGITVSMLEDLQNRIYSSVSNLSLEETDFLLDEDANRVGAMILHLAATEKYYQVYTFQNRGLNQVERNEWSVAMNLGKKGRNELQGKPISYYITKWNEVRAETLRLLKTKDDAWFAEDVEDGRMNNHWAWYHVMEHQANHMGQIRLILGRTK